MVIKLIIASFKEFAAHSHPALKHSCVQKKEPFIPSLFLMADKLLCQTLFEKATKLDTSWTLKA